MKVYLLWDYRDLLGVYATKEAAVEEQTKERERITGLLPGFFVHDRLNDLSIEEVEVKT